MSTPSRTPSPLLPPGTLEAVAAPKSRIRITVLSILALHVVFIGGLLLQGCQKGAQDGLASGGTTNTPAALPSLIETQYFSSYPGDSTASSSQSGTTSAPSSATLEDSATTTTSSLSSTIYDPVIPDVIPPGPEANRFPSSTASSAPAPAAFAPSSEHVIKQGDTIGGLATRYGVTVQAILDANPDVQPRRLKVNSILQIPGPTGTVARAETELTPPPGGDIYIVKSGDNLTRIARKFGVTVRQIRTANNMRNDRILPKQRLIIPAKNSGEDSTGTVPGNGRGNG
jgi:LysM repeat protein